MSMTITTALVWFDMIVPLFYPRDHYTCYDYVIQGHVPRDMYHVPFLLRRMVRDTRYVTMSIFRKKFLPLFIALSLAIQVLFLFIPFYFNDFYRYLWDGWLIVSGINPYSFTPETVELFFPGRGLQEVWYWELLHFKQFLSGYGPMLMVVFGLAGLIAPNSGLFLKFLFLLCNVGSMYFGVKMLEELKLSRWRILLLALSPLFLFETIVGGHTEAVMIFLFMLTMYGWVTKRFVVSGMSFAGLVATKYFPVLLLPLFFLSGMKIGDWRLKIRNFLLAFLFSIVLLYLPFALTTDSIIDLFASAGLLGTQWVMSPGLFDVVWSPLRDMYAYDRSLEIAKLIMTPITLLGIGLVYRWYAKTGRLFDAIYYVLFILLALSSVVFSWYVLWLVMLLPFVRHWLPGLILSCTILFQYLLWYYDPVDMTEKYMSNGLVLPNQVLIWLPVGVAVLYCWLKEDVTNEN